jgi:hypothetical protein
MIRLFQLLVYGHVHKWDFIRDMSEFEARDRDAPAITYRIYACKRCGAIKRVKV